MVTPLPFHSARRPSRAATCRSAATTPARWLGSAAAAAAAPPPPPACRPWTCSVGRWQWCGGVCGLNKTASGGTKQRVAPAAAAGPQLAVLPQSPPGPPPPTWYRIVRRASGAVQLLEKAPATPPLSSSLPCAGAGVRAARRKPAERSYFPQAAPRAAQAKHVPSPAADCHQHDRVPPVHPPAQGSRASKRWRPAAAPPRRQPPRRPVAARPAAPAAPHPPLSPGSGRPPCPGPPARPRRRRAQSACRVRRERGGRAAVGPGAGGGGGGGGGSLVRQQRGRRTARPTTHTLGARSDQGSGSLTEAPSWRSHSAPYSAAPPAARPFAWCSGESHRELGRTSQALRGPRRHRRVLCPRVLTEAGWRVPIGLRWVWRTNRSKRGARKLRVSQPGGADQQAQQQNRPSRECHCRPRASATAGRLLDCCMVSGRYMATRRPGESGRGAGRGCIRVVGSVQSTLATTVLPGGAAATRGREREGGASERGKSGQLGGAIGPISGGQGGVRAGQSSGWEVNWRARGRLGGRHIGGSICRRPGAGACAAGGGPLGATRSGRRRRESFLRARRGGSVGGGGGAGALRIARHQRQLLGVGRGLAGGVLGAAAALAAALAEALVVEGACGAGGEGRRWLVGVAAVAGLVAGVAMQRDEQACCGSCRKGARGKQAGAGRRWPSAAAVLGTTLAVLGTTLAVVASCEHAQGQQRRWLRAGACAGSSAGARRRPPSPPLTKHHDGAQPLPARQRVSEEQAGEQDRDELARGHDRGEQQRAKGLDRVAAGRRRRRVERRQAGVGGAPRAARPGAARAAADCGNPRRARRSKPT